MIRGIMVEEQNPAQLNCQKDEADVQKMRRQHGSVWAIM